MLQQDKADNQDEDDKRGRAASAQATLARNPALVCVFHGVHMSLLPIAIITLFLRDDLGLDMFGVFLLQAIFGGAVALLEFPGGYLADRIGYRRTLVLGSGSASVGWIAYALAWNFPSVVVAELLMAFGLALISGADTALMYESLLAVDEEATYTRWFSRYRTIGNVAEGTAALLGSALYAFSARLPFALQALLWIGNMAIALKLVEPARTRAVTPPSLAHAAGIVRYALFEAPRLRAIIGLFLAFSVPTYAMIWILPSYATDAGIAVALMGPIWACASYVVAAGSMLAPRLGERFGRLPALGVCVVLLPLGYVGLGLTHAWYGVLFYAALCLLRGLNQPLLLHEEQRAIPSAERASLLSLKSLAFRASFVVIGPLIGHALDLADQHQVLLALALPFTLWAALAWLGLAHARNPQAVPVRL